MAKKDDYNYIVHNILTYLYSCFQRKNSFTENGLYAAAGSAANDGSKSISREYVTDVLRYMQSDGLISGLQFTKIWGGEYILSDISGIEITSAGIKYLLDDSAMKEIRETILNGVGAVTELVKMVFLE